MPTSEPLVSVVTPVYNGERFLGQCIESVLAQTYSNWDYTIVNNCSTDRTLEIAQEYAAKEARIRVVTNQAFVRVNANYNNAFRQISPQSKYCKVVGADDLLMPECLEKMVSLAEAHPTVGIVGAYGMEGGAVRWQGLPYPSPVVPGREMARASLMGRYYVFGTATAVLFRSTVVRGRKPFYNESNLHADTEACFRIMEDHDFGFVHQVLTSQGVRDGSLTSMSQCFRTYYPGVLGNLVEFGPKFLTDAELRRHVHGHLNEYYWYLGRQVFRRRDKVFWEYHRNKLAILGWPLSRARLGRYAVWVGLGYLLDVRSSAGKAVRRWARRARSDACGASIRASTVAGLSCGRGASKTAATGEGCA